MAQPISQTPTERTFVAERQLCFTCAYWRNTISTWMDDPMWIRIAGVSYYLRTVLRPGIETRPRDADSGPRGFGGTEFRVRRLGKMDVVRSDDVWSQGKMSEWVQKQFPDNAEFVRDETIR